MARKNLSNLKSEEAKAALTAIFDTDDKNNIQFLSFFNAGKLFMILVVLLVFYKHWLGEDSLVTDVKTAIEIENSWRTVPFFDDDAWGQHIRKFGLPVMKTDGTNLPKEPGKGLIFSLKDAKYIGQELDELIGFAFGLPMELTPHALQRILVRSIVEGAKEGSKITATM